MRRRRESALASHSGTNAAILDYSMRTVPIIRLPPRQRESALASRVGTNATIFGITTKFTALQLQYVHSTDITTTSTVQGGEGNWRWRLAEGQTPQFLVLQYQPNFCHYNYSMCTVPILRLLPQHKEVMEIGVCVLQRDKHDVRHTNITTTTTVRGGEVIRRCYLEEGRTYKEVYGVDV